MMNRIDPAQAISALENCYREYIRKYQELQAGITVQDILAGWVGSGKIKEQQGALYEEYIVKGCSCIDDLCAALDGLVPEEASQWAARGIETILFYPKTDSDLIIMLIAMESLAEPLISMLDRETLMDLIGRYQKRTPKYRMLPNQSALLKVMRKHV